jgi:hypothetical protein
MKKNLIFIIVVILLIIGGMGIYFIAFSESEEDMRKIIEDAYYEDQFLEVCKNQEYTGFKSRQDCEGAVKCISMEIAELIRTEDLKDMSEKMKWSERREHTMALYTIEINIDRREIESMMQYCLTRHGYNNSK